MIVYTGALSDGVVVGATVLELSVADFPPHPGSEDNELRDQGKVQITHGLPPSYTGRVATLLNPQGRE